MAESSTPTYSYMNGWDLIAGTKQRSINAQLQKLGDKHIDYEQGIVKAHILLHPPSISVKEASGRQIDVFFPVSGTLTVGTQIIELPATPKPQSIIATLQLKQIKADLQDKKGENKTRYDLIFDLQSKNLIVKYEDPDAKELSILTEFFKNLLVLYIHPQHKFTVTSFYLNNDLDNKFKAFIPHLAEFTFIRDKDDVDNSDFLLLMLTLNQKRGNIIFNAPILPKDVEYLVMINNHLFLSEMIYPQLVSKIKEEAKNKDDVDMKFLIVPNDSTNESWTIRNGQDIPLEKEHDPWISKLRCKVDNSVGQLKFHLDVKADVTFLNYRVETWVKTWLKLQNDNGKISIVKEKEESNRGIVIDAWQMFAMFLSDIIAAFVFSITAMQVASSKDLDLAGTFDSVTTQTVEWPSQNIVLKDVLLPGHIVFVLDIKL